ncbi:hypothetical protein J7379_01130 [Xanthomonas phaseoli pv. dieffenbachiae]|uniref:hypothetical protein n=1 Tax=Xanthomonas TaxID=338 RepID=UPI001300DA79|nr:hypothetical protein [Xanthomonas phaseoli]MBO9774452.1 hypothetical protein [Xanthomonas phaseoli pv. dieffenbachiae]MBO9779923.1 hypothetical protein [Xanthomonas phaseoli pv. dieffenbachiae]MBO9820871.1 hypothetical protein [Xanthomonas phaseoli pv. dieffenbachiae]MBO9825113.1 hypothetical protein [Xanthomonas phaseoli pv. dieffenbachiae]MBO9837183.1 hypothetical protein [Xanthomonas phaseoli pv. dieffenbachiae]
MSPSAGECSGVAGSSIRVERQRTVEPLAHRKRSNALRWRHRLLGVQIGKPLDAAKEPLAAVHHDTA